MTQDAEGNITGSAKLPIEVTWAMAIAGGIIRVRNPGTHRGDFMGYPASGGVVTTTWIEIFCMEDGRAAEGWLESDPAAFRSRLVADPG